MHELAAAGIPNERDFEAFRLVRVEHCSTRDAAQALGVSQTRICQILKRVDTFLLAHAPEGGEEFRRQRMEIALTVAGEQLGYLIGQALQSFASSKTPQRTVRETRVGGQPPIKVVCERQSTGGDPRYLHAAQKLSERRAKMPAASLISLIPFWEAEDEDDEDETEAAAPSPATAGCSPAPVRPPVTAARRPAKSAVSPLQLSPSVLPSPEVIRPNPSAPATVQPSSGKNKRSLSTEQMRQRRAFLTRAS